MIKNIHRPINTIKKELNHNVTLPFDMIKGNAEKKRQIVSEFNTKIYDAIMETNPKDIIKFRTIKDAISKVLPEKKRIEIQRQAKRFKEISDGGSDFIYDVNENIVGQTLELPTKGKNFELKNIATLMHELTHIFDNFVNPKYIKRTNEMNKYNLFSDDFMNLYRDKLYHLEFFQSEAEKQQILKERRNDIITFLQGKPTKDKITTIQHAKNFLESERNAYTEQLKFAKKLQKTGREIDKEDLIELTVPYLFNEKINMLKEIGIDIIQKIRHSTVRKSKASL